MQSQRAYGNQGANIESRSRAWERTISAGNLFARVRNLLRRESFLIPRSIVAIAPREARASSI